MDADLLRVSGDAPLSPARGHVVYALVGERSAHSVACHLCRRTLSPDSDELDPSGVCGDCKFLLVEGHENSARNLHNRRHNRRRRTRYHSFNSYENSLSLELSDMFNLVRQNQSAVSAHEDPSVDGDASSMLVQHTSTHTTPSGSTRWRRVLSDTESESFDNLDSVYGESETNVSLSQYRGFHGESDAVSFSLYGGDSDTSVDGHSFMDTEMFIRPDEESNLNSDTDIDPMHAGLNQWDSDDTEEEEEEEEEENDEEDGEWEEADVEEETSQSVEAEAPSQNFFISSLSGGNDPINWFRRFHSSENEHLIRWRDRQVRRAYNRHRVFGNLEGFDISQTRNSGDYLDARGFEEFLEHLAETDNSRRGAPPAAASFVKNLPLIAINSEHAKHDDLACAICKDLLSIGSEVNQLPCLHLYHPCCILPWLSTRNSCPLCRFELPTDERDYEEVRLNSNDGMRIRNVDEDASSYVSEGDEAGEYEQGLRNGSEVHPGSRNSERESNSGRWFFVAAAPIVSLVGIALVFWLGNPQGRRSRRHANMAEGGLHIPTSQPNQRPRGGNSGRRSWSLF